jgi:ADP-heptose:LPS heptosyltransferase
MPHIWIIRPGALGDTILTIPLLHTLRKAHPRAKITLLASRAYKELVPESFSFKPLDDRESLWLFQNRVIESLRIAEKPDAAYVILKHPETVILNLEAIGVQNIFQANPTPAPGKHLVESLHSQLGLPLPDRYPVLRKSEMAEREHFVWAHPGSGGLKKMVPVTLFAEIYRIIREKFRCDLVITLGEADMEIKSNVQWTTWLSECHPTVIENRSLKELSIMLRKSRLYIGNDSGISHLAAGLGIQSVLFFTETDPIQWAPWVPHHQLKIMDYRSNNLPKDFANEASRIVDLNIQSLV